MTARVQCGSRSREVALYVVRIRIISTVPYAIVDATVQEEHTRAET
jgi:hypothetical protein